MNAQSRILVCDGDPQSLRGLRLLLRDAGFAAEWADTAEAALDQAALRPPDAAIFELALPDGDGVALCRQLREWSTMPLIVVSAIDDEDHIVRALDSGADDYITKPFGPRELVARLRAALRRAERGDNQPRLGLDGLEVDLARRAVRRDGEELKLTPIEYKLLRALVRHRGRLLTHRELLQEVWGAAYLGDRATLRTHVANLRRKLGPAGGPGPIRTYSGAGYRFVVTEEAGDRATRPPLRLVPSPRPPVLDRRAA
jgi:two-component system, OmpR family, KDP operon response regulator KdpE